MAQWKETLEPYVKVYEKIKTAAVNPVAGEDLIIGAVIISDSGPSTPTLISSQSEFLSTYASKDLTKKYVESINTLYKGDDSKLASTIWLNAYRLAGSATMLVVRANKAKDITFAKPLSKGTDQNAYILRDGQMLKKIPEFKLVIDRGGDDASHSSDGWSICINGIGVIGNRVSDDGVQYDYYVKTLKDLVDYLNDTSMFFSPSYTFYTDENGTVEATDADSAVSVVFHEVYVGANLIDTTDTRCPGGLYYTITCEKDWTIDNPTQKVIDLNTTSYSKFNAVKNYATNKYNTSSDLHLRIRRFNHDAVISKDLSENDAYAGGDSPYTVLTSVLETFTSKGTKTPSDDVLYRDFYEIAVLDPSLDANPLYFNLGNILGRGDMTEADINDSLKMIGLQLPDDLKDLGLGYYGYLASSNTKGWAKIDKPTDTQKTKAVVKDAVPKTGTVGDIILVGKKDADYYQYTSGKWTSITKDAAGNKVKYNESSLDILAKHVVSPAEGEIAKVGDDVAGVYYEYKDGLTLSDVDPEEIYVDLKIDPTKYAILDVSDTDMMKALDLIGEDEIYTTEGLTDLGNTNPMFQTYMANMAVNQNYFYPISTVDSTNYLAIANSISRISKDSSKLYASAPWDIDTGTVGFRFDASPSVIFWEAVCRNRALDREFASVFGFGATGVVQYQNPVVEFNKRQRQLLLSKRVNTVKWNTQDQTWNMNDSYTKESEDNILSEDGNSRLMIRISKAQPTLLRQFIGRKINDALYNDMTSVIDYWFKTVIMPMTYTIDDYRITIADINSDEDIRANRVNVLVEVRFQRSLKYVVVYNEALDMGLDFTGQV